MIKWGFISGGCKASSSFKKSINVTHNINRTKKKSYMIITIDAEKTFNKIQHPFMTKTVSRLGTKSNFLNLIRHIYQKSTN